MQGCSGCVKATPTGQAPPRPPAADQAPGRPWLGCGPRCPVQLNTGVPASGSLFWAWELPRVCLEQSSALRSLGSGGGGGYTKYRDVCCGDMKPQATEAVRGVQFGRGIGGAKGGGCGILYPREVGPWGAVGRGGGGAWLRCSQAPSAGGCGEDRRGRAPGAEDCACPGGGTGGEERAGFPEPRGGARRVLLGPCGSDRRGLLKLP